MKKLKNLKIGTKIVLLVTGVIIFLSAVVSLVSYSHLSKAMEEHFASRVQEISELGYNWFDTAYEGEWQAVGDELYKGDVRVNDNNELIDEIGEITDGAVTIFLGDTRVATNVVDERGQRATGTKSTLTVTDTVLTDRQSYLGTADILGNDYITVYSPIIDQDGEVIGMWFTGVEIKVIQDTILSFLMMLFVVITITAVIAIVISILITRSIVRPISSINQQLKEISDGEGDLTKTLDVESQDEVGELAQSFNRMIGSLRRMIGQIGSTSEQVAASSKQLTASAEQTTVATSEIAHSIEEVASGAEVQEQGANESSMAMNDMAKGVQQVAETTSTISELAQETNREANAGNESIQKAITQMDTINSSVSESASVIKTLGEHSNQIGTIIEVITGIAEQTNLLALNAAIESARAGEHGRGFAVVADQVRKLAEQSKESADQITGLIGQIKDDIENAVDLMDTGTKEASEGMNIVTEAGEGFQRILESIGEVTGQIQEVSAAAEEMSASVEEVNASIEEIAHISKNSADNTQSVASAAEEQMASMQEITSSANFLSDMAEDLQDLVNKFKV